VGAAVLLAAATCPKLGKPGPKSLELFDVFKGQTTERDHSILEDNNILYNHVPNCCTDRLQPSDLSENKAVKFFLRDKF